MAPPGVPSSARMVPRIQETRLLVYYRIQDMIEDTDGKANGVGSRRVPECRNICPYGVGVHHTKAHLCSPQPRSSLITLLLGISWRFHHAGMIDY